MTMTTKLSIAMATYNGEEYLPEQLSSFIKQERLPDELVVCDDGSTDRSIELLASFAETAPFAVRVVQNPHNIGHEKNFGKAIDLCSGDIIFLADQDDFWHRAKFSAVEKMFADDPDALLVVNDASITDGKLQPTGRTVLEQTRAAGVLGANAKSLTLGCATAFRSSLRELISPIPSLDYGHDSWIHDFTEVIGGRRVLPRSLQLYRRHDQNVSNWAFNGGARASPLTVMRPSAGKDLSNEYSKRVRALSLMRERVQALGPERFATLVAGRTYAAVLEDITSAIAAVERRKAVFGHGAVARKILALRMLAGGQYQYFLGWRSFVKDLIR
jgi:glycosyltransferase involved in cell wall biosynthesis